MSLARSVFLQRWTAPALVALATLSTLFAAGLTFRRATTPWARLPDFDYWANISGVISENGVRLGITTLLQHNNEHIVIIPKLIYAANYIVTSGSNIGLITYSIFIGALCSTLILILAKDLLIDTPLRFALCALLFPLLMFSTKLTHSYFMGMSGTIWLTADLFVIISAAALTRAVTTANSIWLLISIGAALLGVLSYSTAVFSLLVLLLSSLSFVVVPRLRGVVSRPLAIASIVIVASVLVIGLVYGAHPKNHPALEFNPGRLFTFVLIYIGSSLPTGRHMQNAAVAGIAILAAGIGAIIRLVAQGRTKEILTWIILFWYAPFNALMTGIGRLGFGMGAAASSRYQSVTALTVIAAITLILAALPRGATSRSWAIARGVFMSALVVAAPLIILDPTNLRSYSARNQKKAIAEIALNLGIEGDQHIKAATPAIDQLDKLIPVLRAAHHVPFDRGLHCEEMLGDDIPETAAAPAGALESVSVYEMSHGAGPAIEVSGWAERDGATAKCIAVLDGARRVIGLGASITERFDVGGKGGLWPGLAGWTAVAHYPQSLPVCAVALFANVPGWIPLSDCEKAMGNSGGAPLNPATDLPIDGPYTKSH
jgi:hypothetical protein